ncbi:uncharacterized protein PY17X_1108000 [Plasmodium yoelii]|uniref:PfATPase3 n=2 Tax=Plasmodium yoelii TaxID=5861 RepID=Q7RGL6_PLAYO|nr:uncharacterized protein PY17X_1108000 [Plasmodium yoelii]EAA16178.1 PfATPase3 [Plasmodium yoelii yoelii]VTZ79359.1 PIMMS2 protein, putative [Plasmodium yoelii]|eukprot:XP_724613.3 uncharacterized protein PY17X_1108000 [Plasmodium yoelii]
MVLLNGKFKYIAVVAIFYNLIILLVKEKFPYMCTQQKSHTISNRILYEYLNNFVSKDIFRRDDITLKNLNFVETNLKNDKDAEIKENSDTQSVDDNMFQRVYKFVLNFFYGNKKNRINKSMNYGRYDNFNKINDIFEFMRNNGLPINITSVCLIDTGLNIKDELINYFLNHDISTYNSYTYHSVNINYKKPDSFNLGVNSENCDEDSNSECESTFLENHNGYEKYEDRSKIQGDTLKLIEKKYEKNVDLQKSGINVEICKTFDNSKEKKNDSNIIPVIKCLEYCKTKNVKIIHIDYNINEKNEQLMQIIEDLKKSEIFVVLPSKKLFNEKSHGDNSVIYPFPFFEDFEHFEKFEKFENVFFLDSINSSLKKGDDHDMLDYEIRYSSAFFINIITIILNIYPNISIKELRNILSYSILSKETPELKTENIFEGNFDINRFIHILLNRGIIYSDFVQKYEDVTPNEPTNKTSVLEGQEDGEIEPQTDSSTDIYYDEDGSGEGGSDEGGSGEGGSGEGGSGEGGSGEGGSGEGGSGEGGSGEGGSGEDVLSTLNELDDYSEDSYSNNKSEQLLEDENGLEDEPLLEDENEFEGETSKDLYSVKENDIYVIESKNPTNSSFMQMNYDDRIKSKYVDNLEDANYQNHRAQFEINRNGNRYPIFSEDNLRDRQNTHNIQMVNDGINYSENGRNIEELYDNDFEGYRGKNLNPEYNNNNNNNNNINREFGILNSWRKNDEGLYLNDNEEASQPFEWMDMHADDIYQDRKKRLKENNYDNKNGRGRRIDEDNKRGRYIKNRNMQKKKKFDRDVKNKRYLNRRRSKRQISKKNKRIMREKKNKYNNSILKRNEMKSHNNPQKSPKIIPRRYSR